MKELLPTVSVVIPTRDRQEMLVRLLDSIINSDYPLEKLEIIIIDDASKSKITYAPRAKDIRIKIIRNNSRKYLASCRNIGIKNSEGQYIFFIDDDNVLAKDTISILVSAFDRIKNLGVAVPLMFYYSKPDKLWHNYYSDPLMSPLIRKRYDLPLKLPIMLEFFHNAFMIPRKIFKEVGLFDSYMFPIHLSEVEFAQRLNRKGYIIALIPEARVWHDAPPYIVRAKGMDNARAFYTLRNRIILARRRSPLYLLFFHILCFTIVINISYEDSL
jgi:GT2 family glycosyltransferase